jgi:uncharacterized protein YbjT (DUF2867 family)
MIVAEETKHSKQSPNRPTVLVVGATGQLGGMVTQDLLRAGYRVRALVRVGSNDAHLRALNLVELIDGDLRDAESIAKACVGVSTIVATATAMFPRRRYDSSGVEQRGYEILVQSAINAGIDHIVYISIAAPYVSRYIEHVPTLAIKLNTENLIIASGLNYTIFRSAPFMDDYFALIGSDIPLIGTNAATLLRPFWMSEKYIRATSKLIERWGIASVPGRSDRSHSFIALEDVSRFLVAAVKCGPANQTVSIGGARAYTWAEIASIYGRLFKKKVRVLPTGPVALRASMRMLQPFSAAAANQLGVLWVLSENDIIVDPSAAIARYGVVLTSPQKFLGAKFNMRKRSQPGPQFVHHP